MRFRDDKPAPESKLKLLRGGWGKALDIYHPELGSPPYRDLKPANSYSDEDPTLPSQRCPDAERLPIVPMWRVVLGLLLLEDAP